MFSASVILIIFIFESLFDYKNVFSYTGELFKVTIILFNLSKN